MVVLSWGTIPNLLGTYGVWFIYIHRAFTINAGVMEKILNKEIPPHFDMAQYLTINCSEEVAIVVKLEASTWIGRAIGQIG